MSFWQREKEKDSCPTTTYNISNKTAWYPKEMIFPSSLSAFHLPFIHQSLRWHFMVNVPSFYFHALPLCTTLWQLIYWSYFYQTRKIHLTFYEPQKSSVAPNVVNRSSEKKTLKKLKEEKKSGRRCMTSRFSATGKQSHWQHWQLFPFCRERRRAF